MKKNLLIFLFIFSFEFVFSHNGHGTHTDAYGTLWWLGNFHPLFLQFPIVLTLSTAFAELIYRYSQNVIFSHAARFMMLGAAIMVIPTVLLGLVLGYKSEPEYNEFLIGYFWWHRFFGILTGLLIIATAYVREYQPSKTFYYCMLLCSVVSVILTGYLGGSITFGPFALLPPAA
jgi:uncharacterized membrane protein